MGIIVSTMVGMGADYMTSALSTEIRILNLLHDERPASDIVDEVSSNVGANDIVFVPMSEDVISELCDRRIDFDVFYPTKERRIEIIEGFVRNKVSHAIIAETDRNFNKIIDFIEKKDSECCHKHRMDGKGQDVANNSMLAEYIQGIESEKKMGK